MAVPEKGTEKPGKARNFSNGRKVPARNSPTWTNCTRDISAISPESQQWKEYAMNHPVKFAPEKERPMVGRVNARLQVSFGPDSQVLTGYSLNVSQGGLFLETTRLLQVDSPFALPDSENVIRCRGRVAWVNHLTTP
jgi:hypothetical protein